MAGFWLVKTGTGGSEVRQLPDGQSPLQARWGGAVYLGPTVQDVNAWIGKAAKMLGTPNPQHVPSLSTSTGIIGSELFGLAPLLGEAGTAADAAVTADASSAASGGAGAAGGTAAGKIAGSVGGKGLAELLGAAGIAAFGVRALQALAGAALILLGLQALTGTGTNGSPMALAGKMAKVVK